MILQNRDTGKKVLVEDITKDSIIDSINAINYPTTTVYQRSTTVIPENEQEVETFYNIIEDIHQQQVNTIVKTHGVKSDTSNWRLEAVFHPSFGKLTIKLD